VLKAVHWRVEQFLAERLRLELKPAVLQPCAAGMTFLGYKIFPHRAGLASRSRQRFRRKAKLYDAMLSSGLWTEAARHMEPLIAFIRRGESRGFRERWMAGMERGWM
jgi:hypothetical protein